jgi:polysaccharide biosynthesis protein PslE
MKYQLSFKEFLIVLFKHKMKIVAAFLATFITVSIGTLMVPRIYESTSSILIKFGREYVYRPEVGEKPTNVPRTEMVGIIHAETQIITSKDLIDRVIGAVGLQQIYPDLASSSGPAVQESARRRFMQNLIVQGLEDSGVIRLSFQHNDPKVAARVVNVLVEKFKDKHLETFVDAKTSSFLEAKAAEYSKKLQETEQKLENLKMKHSTYDLEQQRTLLLQQRAQLDSGYKASQDQIAEFGKKLSSLNGQVTSVTENARGYTESDRYKVMDDGKSKLLELQLQEQQLLKKYTETSQHVVQIRNEIKTVQAFLKQQEEELRNRLPVGHPVYQDLQRQIMSAKADHQSQQAKSAVLRQQVAQLDAALQKLSQPENELRDLQRQLATNEQNYQTYAAKLEEARIIEDMNRAKMTNISVIQNASVPIFPVKPRVQFNLMLGFFLGIFLGVGIALLAEFLSQTFSTAESVERRLNVPVLAIVPYQSSIVRR